MFDFDKTTENIGGWLTEAEGVSLYNTAKKVKSYNSIVEIGSWKGRSTICLGSGSRDGNESKIFAIDPHTGSSEHKRMFGYVDTFEEFKKNIKKADVENFITPIRETSENAARDFNHPIEFVFIDGAHEYRFVKLDYQLWFPKLIDGGVIAFHDTWHFIGPRLATAIVLLTSTKVRNPRLVDTITYFEKIQRNSFADRCRNIGFLIHRALFGVKGYLRIKYHGSKVI